MKRVVLALVMLTPLLLEAQEVAQFRLDRQVRVGNAVSGDITFAKIVAVVPGSAGSFYVADAEDKSLRQFDRTGRMLRKFGREGNGPGELQSLSSAGRIADSVWVMDPAQRRASVFGPTGEFIRAVEIPRLGDFPAIVRAITPTALLLQNGTYVRTHGKDGQVVRVAGARTDTVARLWFGTGPWIYRAAGPTPYEVLVPNPFNDASLFATDSKGENLTVVHRLVGDNNTFEVERLDARGKSVWKRLFKYSPRAIPAAVRDSVVARPELRAIAKFPKHMPAVSDVIAGDDGSVWLRREELGSAGRSAWYMLDAAGRMIGGFETAKRFQLHNAQGRELLGVEFDENDAPTVVRYAVVPVR